MRRERIRIPRRARGPRSCASEIDELPTGTSQHERGIADATRVLEAIDEILNDDAG